MQAAVFAVEPVIIRDLGQVAAAFGADVEITSTLDYGDLNNNLIFRKFFYLFLFHILRQDSTRTLHLMLQLIQKAFVTGKLSVPLSYFKTFR